MSAPAIRRLQKELSDIQKKPQPDFTLNTVGDNMFVWQAVLNGPAGTPYEGGKFKVNISIPDNYPHKAPTFSFSPPVYHPNVDKESGLPCLDKLSDKWAPATFLKTICSELIQLLKEPNPAHSVNEEIGKEFVDNRAEFDRKAREWTQKNAK